MPEYFGIAVDYAAAATHARQAARRPGHTPDATCTLSEHVYKREQRPMNLDRYSPAAMAKLAVSNRRLDRMEALLVEMRSEQDVSLKHLARLQDQLDILTESAAPQGIRHVARPRVLGPRILMN
jgi:hypothetical protein